MPNRYLIVKTTDLMAKTKTRPQAYKIYERSGSKTDAISTSIESREEAEELVRELEKLDKEKQP